MPEIRDGSHAYRLGERCGINRLTFPVLKRGTTIEFPFDTRTWLVSDTHFFHANIGRYCNRPDGWQELIIANWNLHIQPGNIVFHLGDLAFGRKENLEALVPQLNGRLYLMRGNHDRRGVAYYRDLGITLVKDPYCMEMPEGKRLVFSHRPIIPLAPGLLNLHGHIHNNATAELGPGHINLSIEVRQYRPWRLKEILQMSPLQPHDLSAVVK